MVLLAPTDLRAAEGGHEYVLSRLPCDVERKTLRDRMHEDCALTVTFLDGDTIQVEGLTADNRAGFERELRKTLAEANAARAVEETLSRGGGMGEWGQAKYNALAAAMEQSFAELPDELPSAR